MGILRGLKILDFSTLLPGPFATMMLADMGAEVLKIEAPNREDFLKYDGVMDGEVSATFAHLNRSKRSLALDLKLPESIEIVYQLIKDYDIVVEQFRPGVMDKLGIGYEKLKEINPAIIFCSITGYGQTGPLRNQAGHDINYLSLAGVSSYSFRKGQTPVPAGVQVADLAGGSMPAVIGILAAVYNRQKTGEGQHIDISLTDVSFSLNALYGPSFLVGGIEPTAESLLLNGGSFYDYYETRDNRYISVGSLEPQFQKMLCELLGDPALFKLSSSENRADHLAFKEKLIKTFKEKTLEEWNSILKNGFNGCVEPVLNFSEAVEHPHIKARELVVSVPKYDEGIQKQIAFPIKFSTQPGEYRFAGVQTGTHTNEILEELGLDSEMIKSLIEKGIFGSIKQIESSI
ncbi:Crotonobetainyl-CoA:carnitine CoA-transferase CaiB [Psychrobacillus sp. OK028]|uniref:CaiB/BaiF CoA transferase family protein n=1 Tax=Psychrobacillus sp. OK028 TaxID=1884359 RepID=UPI00088F5624|nr:CaiB/BaiF CoA-transferase family protein [Psychrobacillus sp. OK028]SDO24459.1 Crotonobetainyl-CoA:carnitine CoA-transferase CaiB [Psychrobacillus sp. OK028]